jgi:hypothetical protein
VEWLYLEPDRREGNRGPPWRWPPGLRLMAQELQIGGTRDDNARTMAGVIRGARGRNRSALVGSGGNAGNISPIEANIGQFAISQPGQLVQVALVVPERLDHADK